MSLDATRLKDAIKSAIIACRGAPQDPARLECFCSAIATPVVNEIVGNATVLPGSFQAGGDPVTGTGTVS